MLVYELMDRDTGFEPAPSAWKAEMLAADTNPGFEKVDLSKGLRNPTSIIWTSTQFTDANQLYSLSTLYIYYIRNLLKNQIFISKVFVGLS